MISIIVPARDAASSIEACLDALAAQTGLSRPPEVIVVDDGSRDGTADRVRAHALQPLLVEQPQRGAAAARNRGAARAQGELLLFTDADCRPRPDWAVEMCKPFSDLGVAGVKGFFETDQLALVARFTQAEYEEKEAHMLRHASVPFADTAAAAYRTEVFRAAGGFREDMLAVEDTELAFRLAAAGQRIVVAPAARVLHAHPERVSDYVRRKWRYGLWGAQAYSAHPGRVADDARTPASMRLQLLLAPLILVAAMLAPSVERMSAAAVLLILVFLASTLPLIRFAAAHGRDVQAVAPLLSLLRALALDAGLLAGLARAAWRGRTGRPVEAGNLGPPSDAEAGEPPRSES